jgi:hypothetical protein
MFTRIKFLKVILEVISLYKNFYWLLIFDAVIVENLNETLRGESGFGSSGLY